MVLEKSHKFLIGGLIFVLIGLAVTAWYYYRMDRALLEETVSVFENAPGEAPYTDLYGKPVNLTDYLGQVLVVVTWASWSPFSAADLITLSDLSNSYGDEVVFLAINRKETKEQAQRYVATLPELPGLVVALDPRDHFYTAVGGYAMPEALVYGRRGEIVLHARGVTDREAIKAKIDEALAAE